MRYLKLYEEFCEGDMEDMISFMRGIDKDLKIDHYGFDYIGVKISTYGKSGKDNEIETERIIKEITDMLLKKFDKAISEIYSEETGWFKIYLDSKGNQDRTSR